MAKEATTSGSKLTGQLGQDMQGGILYRGQRSTSTGVITTTEIGVVRLDGCALKAGRGYSVMVSMINMSSTVVDDDIIAVVRYSTSGAATNASTILDYARGQTADTTHTPKRGILGFIFPSADATYSFWLGARRVAGAGNVSIVASDAVLHIVVRDEGDDPGDTGVVI
jgi:hypothetical protein